MPEVYYDMLPKDFEALVIGYHRRLNNDSAEMRRATYITILPHVQKLPFDQFCRNFWPLETDMQRQERKIDTNVSNEMFEKIMQRHNKRRNN